jgi:hypothetical protein
MWEFGKLIGAVWGFCCSAWRLVFAKTKYRNCDVGHVCGVIPFSLSWRIPPWLACLHVAWCKLYSIT